MGIVEEKEKNNRMTQKQFEEAQMKWARGIVDQTERMTAKQRKSWDGKVKDVPAAPVPGGSEIKKEKS